MENQENLDKKLVATLLVASKKVIIRKWIKVEPHSGEEWINLTHHKCVNVSMTVKRFGPSRMVEMCYTTFTPRCR